MSEVIVPQKTPEMILDEQKAAYQAELAALKIKYENAVADTAAAQAAYEAASATTVNLGKDRLALEKYVRDEAKKMLEAFEANVRVLKEAKLKTSIALDAAKRTELDLGNAWNNVKHDYVDLPAVIGGAQVDETGDATPVTGEATGENASGGGPGTPDPVAAPVQSTPGALPIGDVGPFAGLSPEPVSDGDADADESPAEGGEAKDETKDEAKSESGLPKPKSKRHR